MGTVLTPRLVAVVERADGGCSTELVDDRPERRDRGWSTELKDGRPTILERADTGCSTEFVGWDGEAATDTCADGVCSTVLTDRGDRPLVAGCVDEGCPGRPVRTT